MATRAPEQVPAGGIAGTYYAASGGGDRVPPGSLIHVKNAGGTVCVPTFVTPGVIDTDLAVADRVGIAVPITTGMNFYRVPTDRNYVDPADNQVLINWSFTTSVTFAVLS